MSRRKQAKPRALKREDVDDLPDESTEDIDICDIKRKKLNDKDIPSTMVCDSNSGMDGTLNDNSMGTPNISMTDFEISQESELNGGASTPTSCRSSDTPDEPSMSPTSLSEGDGGDLPFTIGVTEATPHACHYCDKAFHRHQHLKMHEQEHAKGTIFQCDFCTRLFKHKRSRDRHVKLHTGEKKYKCKMCPSQYSRSDHLKIHMKSHTGEKAYPCHICNRGYKTAASLTSHLQTHKKENLGKDQPPPDKPYRCLSCPAYFATPQELQEHGLTHPQEHGLTHPHPESMHLQCSFCRESFSYPELLREHVEVNHVPETQGRCSVCSETFEDLEDLLKHKKVHKESKKSGPTSPSRYPCTICPKDYATLDMLRRHQRSKHHERPPVVGRGSSSSPLSNPRATPEAGSSPSTPYACEYCMMKFPALRDLQQHTIAVHCHLAAAPNNKDSVYCTLCNTGFGDALALNEHVKQVHEKDQVSPRAQAQKASASVQNNPLLYQGPFLCSQCNAALPNFEEFAKHLQCHHPTYNSSHNPLLMCFLCGEQTVTEAYLMHHVARHFRIPTTEYRCYGCSSVFPELDQLQRHMMDQHAHQLFRCNVCALVFENKVDLQLHFTARHSHASRVIKCKECEEVFRTDHNHRIHVKMAHMSPAFRCSLCNLGFLSDSELKLHYQAHRTYSCTICGAEFHVEYLLDRHVLDKHTSNDANVAEDLSIKTPPNKVTHRCNLCDATFAVESALNTHRSQAHNIRISSSQKQGQTALSLDCAYCHEPFKSRTELANHTKSHCTSSGKHKCNICDELFPSAATLSEHKLSHLKGETHRSCVVCHHSLRDEADFNAHFHEHNVNDIPAPCVICRQSLLTAEDVKVHARHHLKIQDTCCVCGKNNPTQMMIINGTSESHSFMCKDCFRSNGMAYRSNECSLKLENPDELSNHVSSHSSPLGPKLFECLKCQVTCKNELEMKGHIWCHIRQEGNDHKCHLCENILDSPAKLQCHLIEHTFERASTYRCYLCSAVFTGPHLIQQHMVEVHVTKDKPYRCEQCPLSFFFKAELDNHVRDHSDSFRCPDCGQTFPSQKTLQLHSKAHSRKIRRSTEEQRYMYPGTYPCITCSLGFDSYKNLKEHLILKHRRGFECDFCKKTFTTPGELVVHKEEHRRLYPCEQCNQRFTTEEQMTEHMRLHISSTTHPCEMCSSSFESLTELKQHLKASHDKQFEHSCSVCNEVFESSEDLELHAQKKHPSAAMDVESESMSGQSTSSGDTKDGDTSECSSNMEEGDTRDSPLSVAGNMESHAVSQAVS